MGAYKIEIYFIPLPPIPMLEYLREDTTILWESLLHKA